MAEGTARHPAGVRFGHWITALCFLALLVSGIEIVISHPRFYWGETGNVRMEPLFALPIPASRDTVPTGYGYVLPDQNGWSRALHFQSAWAVVITGLLYVLSGVLGGRFRRELWPGRDELRWTALASAIGRHARLQRPDASEASRYNVLQRLAYLGVILVLFPLLIWTGLAMSPAVVSAFPVVVTALGGQQSARTLHFFATLALVLFVAVHVGMVTLAGFRQRTAAMIIGRLVDAKEQR